jgi:hypothetical protein
MGGLRRSLVLAGLFALGVSPCLAGSPLESLPPSMGGLPADAPARPATPYKYPAVHDMPPPRSEKTLSGDQQLQLEKSLEAARDRQMRRAGDDLDDADKPPAVTKKKPSAAKKQPKPAAQAGVKPNP